MCTCITSSSDFSDPFGLHLSMIFQSCFHSPLIVSGRLQFEKKLHFCLLVSLSLFVPGLLFFSTFISEMSCEPVVSPPNREQTFVMINSSDFLLPRTFSSARQHMRTRAAFLWARTFPERNLYIEMKTEHTFLDREAQISPGKYHLSSCMMAAWQ